MNLPGIEIGGFFGVSANAGKGLGIDSGPNGLNGISTGSGGSFESALKGKLKSPEKSSSREPLMKGSDRSEKTEVGGSPVESGEKFEALKVSDSARKPDEEIAEDSTEAPDESEEGESELPESSSTKQPPVEISSSEAKVVDPTAVAASDRSTGSLLSELTKGQQAGRPELAGRGGSVGEVSAEPATPARVPEQGIGRSMSEFAKGQQAGRGGSVGEVSAEPATPARVPEQGIGRSVSEFAKGQQAGRGGSVGEVSAEPATPARVPEQGIGRSVSEFAKGQQAGRGGSVGEVSAEPATPARIPEQGIGRSVSEFAKGQQAGRGGSVGEVSAEPATPARVPEQGIGRSVSEFAKGQQAGRPERALEVPAESRVPERAAERGIRYPVSESGKTELSARPEITGLKEGARPVLGVDLKEAVVAPRKESEGPRRNRVGTRSEARQPVVANGLISEQPEAAKGLPTESLSGGSREREGTRPSIRNARFIHAQDRPAESADPNRQMSVMNSVPTQEKAVVEQGSRTSGAGLITPGRGKKAERESSSDSSRAERISSLSGNPSLSSSAKASVMQLAAANPTEAMNRVMEVVERMSLNNHSSRLQLNINLNNGDNMKVLLKFAKGILQTVFVTDSDGLRNAIKEGWDNLQKQLQAKEIEAGNPGFQGAFNDDGSTRDPQNLWKDFLDEVSGGFPDNSISQGISTPVFGEGGSQARPSIDRALEAYA